MNSPPIFRGCSRVSRRAGIGLLVALVLGLFGAPASAQVPAPPGWAPPPLPPQTVVGARSSGYPSDPGGRVRASAFEMGTLYASATAYGIGMGIWFDAEVGFDDPGVLLIPPTLLGVAAPITAYFLNRPPMQRGLPGAIAGGLVIGAGEGLAIASLQMFSADEPWGFRGLSRAVGIGATVGGIGGAVLGVAQAPSPNISAFATSGVVWGSIVGAAFGLGASTAGVGFSQANDVMARGGLIGFNAGLAVTMGLSTLFVPTIEQLSWMWIGGGVGATLSLPVYLFYIGEGTPPAKRGLLFTATATTLGIVTGGVFGPHIAKVASNGEHPRWASIDFVAPLPLRGGFGLQVGGSLF